MEEGLINPQVAPAMHAEVKPASEVRVVFGGCAEVKASIGEATEVLAQIHRINIANGEFPFHTRMILTEKGNKHYYFDIVTGRDKTVFRTVPIKGLSGETMKQLVDITTLLPSDVQRRLDEAPPLRMRYAGTGDPEFNDKFRYNLSLKAFEGVMDRLEGEAGLRGLKDTLSYSHCPLSNSV